MFVEGVKMSLARVRVPMYNRTGNCVVADDSARALACSDSDSRSAVPSVTPSAL